MCGNSQCLAKRFAELFIFDKGIFAKRLWMIFYRKMESEPSKGSNGYLIFFLFSKHNFSFSMYYYLKFSIYFRWINDLLKAYSWVLLTRILWLFDSTKLVVKNANMDNDDNLRIIVQYDASQVSVSLVEVYFAQWQVFLVSLNDIPNIS